LLHANCQLVLYTVLLTDCGVPVPVHEIQYVELMIVLYFLSYIAHVTKRFAGATASSVKAAMAQKCKDKRNADTKRTLNCKVFSL
jgi:hypothetical protein